MHGAPFSNVYSSLMITQGGTHITVYLTSSNTAAEDALSSLAPAGTVSFAHAPFTRTAMAATNTLVTNDYPSLLSQGIHLVSWFPGIDGDSLEHIGVLNLSSADVTTLDRVFGASHIALANVSPNNVPHVTGTGRDSDSSPWSGGDNLSDLTSNPDNEEGCTSGAGLDYNDSSYMLIAAHCYVPGTRVYNAFGQHTPGPYMGTETSRDVTANGDDTALLSMPVSGAIWTGPIGSPSSNGVTADATNPVGDQVCNEGAYSGAACSIVKSDYPGTGGCIPVGPYAGLTGSRVECHLVEASTPKGGVANQAGDSGGPMIRYIGGLLKVTGIVSAGGGTASCAHNTQYSDECYSIVYYTAMDEILSNEYPGSALAQSGLEDIQGSTR